MLLSKVRTYIGFAVKARKVAFGVDNVLTGKKKPYIIMLDGTLSENSRAKIERYAEAKGTPVYLADLNELLPGRSCKAIGLYEPNLSAAIQAELKESE